MSEWSFGKLFEAIFSQDVAKKERLLSGYLKIYVPNIMNQTVTDSLLGYCVSNIP